MAEAIASTSAQSVPTHEQNISMLLDKLKELKMSAENTSDSRIFGRVEREYLYDILLKKVNIILFKYSIHC